MNNKSYVTVCVNTGVGHYSAMNGVIVTQKSCKDPPSHVPLIYHEQSPSNKWGLFTIILDMQKYSQI